MKEPVNKMETDFSNGEWTMSTAKLSDIIFLNIFIF